MIAWLVALTAAQAEDLGAQNTVVIDVSRSMESVGVARVTENVLDTWQGWRSVAPGNREARFAAVSFAEQATELLAPSSPDGLDGAFVEPLAFGGRAALGDTLEFTDALADASSHHVIVLTDGGIADGPLPTVPQGVVVHVVATGDVFPLQGVRLRALTARSGGSYRQAGSAAQFDVGATAALQQSLQGNTWHVARIDLDPFEQPVSIPHTASALSVVAYGAPGTDVELSLQPPGSAAEPLEDRGSDGGARIDVSAGQRVLGGTWTVSTTSSGPVAAMVMVDNTALRSDLQIPSEAICPGQAVDIDVSARAFGGGLAEEEFMMRVVVHAPSVGVGELLSDLGREPETDGEDPPSEGAGLLAELLGEQPDAPGVSPEDVPWTVTGDGTYRAVYVPPVAGHYEVEVTIAGTSGQTGDFEFHHRESFYAVACPEDDATSVGFEDGQLIVVPAWGDALERLGPGYQGRLWLDIAGRDFVRLVDRYDGSYVADVDEADLASLQVRYVPPLLAPDAIPEGAPLGTIDDGDAPPSTDLELTCGDCRTSGTSGSLGLALVLLPWALTRRRR